MKKIITISLALLTLSSCIRREMEDELHDTALIPVRIDWSKTNFPSADSGSEEYVHRVSLRFFPKDGSPVFDRYMEVDITKDEISLPIGSYSVIAFNESVTDTYWQGSIEFTDVNDYSKFAANIVPDDPSKYDYFTLAQGETLMTEPKRLASWALDHFEVTPEMVTRTRSKQKSQGGQSDLSQDEMINALTKIVMRPLTRQVNVTARVKFLSSAQSINCIKRGFSNRVYMASALRDKSASSFAFSFSSRKWDDQHNVDGAAYKSFMMFGPQPGSILSHIYSLGLDVIFVTGERYKPQLPLLFDIAKQIDISVSTSAATYDIEVAMELPKVSGGVNVGEWEDDQQIIVN